MYQVIKSNKVEVETLKHTELQEFTWYY